MGFFRRFKKKLTMSRKSGSKKVKFAPRTKSAQVALIKSVVKGEAETKLRTYFGGGTGGVTDLGLFANKAYVAKNQFISSNITDIHRIIPQIQQGPGDNNRIGSSITPSSLILDIDCVFDPQYVIAAQSQFELYVVIYVLQHVTLKDYTSLQASNQFTGLLETGEQSTVIFGGDVWSARLPVAKQTYKLLAKRVLPMRTAGMTYAPGTTGATNSVSMANSQPIHRHVRLDLTRHLPKTLKYNESQANNDPTNASPFFACSWFYMNDFTSGVALTPMRMTYVSALRYKDM